MTKEEAQTLEPGDIISCSGNSNRVLTDVWIEGDTLYWHQEGSDSKHMYSIELISITKKKNTIINNYEIY